MYQPFFVLKRKLYFLFSLLAAILALVMCEEESSEPRSYPRLSDVQISNISTEGATFTADLYSLGDSAILQHGFLWGNSRSLDLQSHDRIYLGPLSQTGAFSAEIRTALVEGKDYFVRPFVTISGKTIYGPVVSFKSIGSIGPVITGFQPDSARWGDTLKIYGKNFSWVTNEVFLNDKKIAVLRTSDTLLYALIESNVKSIENNLSVSTSEIRNTFIPKKFRLIAPSITDYSPKQAFWGDTLVIKGKQLKYIQTTGSFVKLGTLNCPVITVASNDSIIKIRVPNDLSTLNSQLTLNVNGIAISGSAQFSLLPPYFSFTPNEGTWRNTITLKGRFHPVASKNTVIIGGNPASINVFSRDSLKVSVPLPLIDHLNTVTLKAAPFTITSQDTFHLYKPVITSISPLKGRTYGMVTVRGKYLHSGYYATTSIVRLGNVNLVRNSTIGDSVIVCQIPIITENFTSQITVIAGNQSDQSEEFFTVINPEIRDFNPKTGTFNDEISIKGKNFTPTLNTSAPLVYFGSNSATVVSFNDSIIVVKVPVAVDSIPSIIKVQVDAAGSESIEKFTLTPPSIISVTPNPVTAPGIDVIINGTGFNPVLSRNKVYWDTYPLTIKSATVSQIIATLPGLMTRNDSRINVATGGYKRGFPVNNDIISKWNKVADFSQQQWGGAGGWTHRPVSFSINGKGYFMDMYGSMMSFNPSDASVIKVSTASTLAYKAGLASVVFRDTGYIMGHNLGLYRFDVVTGSWISKGISPPIPGNNFFGVLFSLQGKLYYGVAFSDYGTSSYGNLNRTLWVFDGSSKTWKQKQSLPAITTNPAVNYFTMNDKGYVLFSDNIFCEYDPVSDTWTRLQNFPVNKDYYGRVAMAINNKIYIGMGSASWGNSTDQFYVYDRGLNSWTLYERIPYGGRTNSCSFIINNKGYVAGGNPAPSNSVFRDVMEFDPAF